MSTWTKPPGDLVTLIRDQELEELGFRRDVDEDDDDSRPGPVTGVSLDFRIREIKEQIDYDGIASWSAFVTGACQADVAWFEIQMEACTAAGNPKPDARRRRIYIVKAVEDLEADDLKEVFEQVKHPDRWYQRARVRVVDKRGREGRWSDWTEPVLPKRAARPGPPAPSNLTQSFDKQSGTGKMKARYRGRVKFSEMEFWDVPPTADRGKVTANLSGGITAGANTITLGTADMPTPAAGERISVSIRPGGDNVEVIDYSGKANNGKDLTGVRRGREGTTAIAHPDNANVVLSAADQQERQNDLRGYDVQMRRCTVDANGNFVAWVRDENNDFVQRTENVSWKKEDNDAGNLVVVDFPKLMKRHWWRSRARTRAKYNLVGDYGDWTAPGSPSDTDPPPACSEIVMTVDPRRLELAYIAPRDTQNPDDLHEDIDHFWIQASDRADFNKSLSNFWREDINHGGLYKSFKKKKTQKGPFHARVCTVDASGNKSTWVSTNKKRKKPGKPKNQRVEQDLRAFVAKADPPTAWLNDDGTEDPEDFTLSEVVHYKLNVYQNGVKDNERSDPHLLTLRKRVKIPKGSTGWTATWESVGHEDDTSGETAATASTTDEALVISSSEIGAGAINSSIQFASNIIPPRVLSFFPWLPDSAYPEGSTFVLNSPGNANHGKLYRNVSGVWSAAVPTIDLSGQITSTQITDQAISTPKLVAGAVTANELSANAVIAGKISTNAVTAGTVAAGAIGATAIAADAITTDKLTALAITSKHTITGALIRTAESGSRVVLGASGELDRISIWGPTERRGNIYADSGSLWIQAPGDANIVLGVGTGRVDFRGPNEVGNSGGLVGYLQVMVGGVNRKIPVHAM